MKPTAVSDVMSTDVVTVRSFVPVVDSMGHAIGVISRTDLIAKGADTFGPGPLF